MTDARRNSRQETVDPEKGGIVGGVPKVHGPEWERTYRETNSVSLDLSNARHSPDQGRGQAKQVRRKTGFPTEQGSHDSDVWFKALPLAVRGHVVSIIGELIGTFTFLFFALAATQLAVSSNRQSPRAASQSISMYLYIALAFGFSLAINAWTFFRVSGGLFNPAVNLALCLVGALTWLRGILLFGAQIIGALIAAAVVSALFPGDLSVDTTLGTGVNTAQGLFIEAFATFELVLVIFMLAAEKHEGRFLAPIGIGIALFVAELAAVPFTGGSLNPARSFAPAVVNHTFPAYHWIYWLGPALGASAAALVYKLLKVLEYETANPQGEDQHTKTLPTWSRTSPTPPNDGEQPISSPTFALNRETTGEEFYHDAAEWPLKIGARALTGFGQGLIFSEAQGSTKKQKRSYPD